VILSSGCIAIGGFLDTFSLDDSFSNFTEINKTDNNSYSVAGVSFATPDGWHVETANFGGDIMIIGSPNGINFPNFVPTFQIEIINNSEISNSNNPIYATPENATEDDSFSNLSTFIPGEVIVDDFSNYSSISTNSNLSEQEIVDVMRNGTDSLGTKISNDTIMINGKTAYRDVYTVNNLWPPVIDQRIEQILFVKNEKTYLFTFEAPNWDYSKEKQNFDMIINSFKVQ
jgi:hypothetical protein